MSNEKPTPEEALVQQTVVDKAAKTYTAHCGVCGMAFSQKKRLFRSHSAEIQKLSRNFNFCQSCKKWVCEDCFYIDDGHGNIMGLCSACAKEQGVSGLTVIQFEEVWPQLQKSRQKRREAAERAIQKQNMEAETG